MFCFRVTVCYAWAMNKTHTKIVAAARVLNSLGDPDAIAEYFAVQGIKGRRANASHCPVAKYVEGRTGTPTSVFRTIGANADMDAQYDTITPENVYQFILNFDEGRYPELVQTV